MLVPCADGPSLASVQPARQEVADDSGDLGALALEREMPGHRAGGFRPRSCHARRLLRRSRHFAEMSRRCYDGLWTVQRSVEELT